jgi:hypothetical protein
VVAGHAWQPSGKTFRLEKTMVEFATLESASTIGVEYLIIRFGGIESACLTMPASRVGSQNDTSGQFLAMFTIEISIPKDCKSPESNHLKYLASIPLDGFWTFQFR